MKVGDLVRMDFTLPGGDAVEDAWGIGVIVDIPDTPTLSTDDIVVFWSKPAGYSWEMRAMLEVMDEER